jgi:hypothetical protein
MSPKIGKQAALSSGNTVALVARAAVLQTGYLMDATRRNETAYPWKLTVNFYKWKEVRSEATTVTFRNVNHPIE